MFNNRFFLFDADAGGNAGGGGGGTPPAPAPTGEGGQDDPSVTFKQSELNKSYAERAARASKKAVDDLLSGLGIKSADDLKALVTKHHETQAAQMSEAEKQAQALTAALARIAELEQQSTQAIKDAQTLRIRSAVEVAAAALKFHNPEDAYLLADLKSATVGDDGKVQGVEDALKALAKARPHLIDKGQGQNTDIDATRRTTGQPGLTDAEKRELAARYGVNPAYIN